MLKVKTKNQDLRQQIVNMLEEEHAHVSLEYALKDLPEELINAKATDFTYSIWQLVEHIRITQWDIVEFCHNPDHVSPDWPLEYWPDPDTPIELEQYEETLKAIKKDRNRMIRLLKNEHNDLLKPFPHGSGQNLLREAILLIDHTSYHTGQIVLIRKLLGAWK